MGDLPHGLCLSCQVDNLHAAVTGLAPKKTCVLATSRAAYLIVAMKQHGGPGKALQGSR